MTIEQATVKMLSSLTLGNELAKDMVDIAIFSVIGYLAVKEILNSADDVFKKYDDLIQLGDEIEHMDINEMVYDFLSKKGE